MFRLFLPAAGLLLLTGSGVLYGIQTGRARDPQIMIDAANRLRAASDEPIDGWSGTKLELTQDRLTAAEAAGGVTIRYTPLELTADGPGSSVDVMLLCGPHGPISVHPPTVCFKGVGYRQCATARRVELTGASGEALGTFWMTDFERDVDGLTERIRTYWGWSADGTWSAPENPRASFAGVPVLYKLYLTERVPADDAEAASAGRTVHLLAPQLLPHLKSSLFVPKPVSGEAAST